ncbi:MAG: hypothetical protein V4662_27395 [Verrucomicrobiota bacterium]
MTKDHPTLPARGWWIAPLIFAICFIAAIVTVWNVSEDGREMLAKSFMTIAGYLGTPFVLETSTALFGLVVVLVFNEWRRAKDGPDYVEMMVEDDAVTSSRLKQDVQVTPPQTK